MPTRKKKSRKNTSTNNTSRNPTSRNPTSRTPTSRKKTSRKKTFRKKSPFGAFKRLAPFLGTGIVSLAGLASASPGYNRMRTNSRLETQNITNKLADQEYWKQELATPPTNINKLVEEQAYKDDFGAKEPDAKVVPKFKVTTVNNNGKKLGTLEIDELKYGHRDTEFRTGGNKYAGKNIKTVRELKTLPKTKDGKVVSNKYIKFKRNIAFPSTITDDNTGITYATSVWAKGRKNFVKFVPQKRR